jgi:hypothetical protein
MGCQADLWILGALSTGTRRGLTNQAGCAHNLALAYWEAGRAAEALPLFEQTLPDRERVLGPDHPDTLGSRNNLATAYHQAGARAC